VQLIQHTVTKGDIPVSFSYRVLVLIPKPENQGFRGITLLETIYIIISMIIHLRLLTTIRLHEAVHGFRTNRVAGTATMQVKLLMQKAR
jgi:hypothetical protein